MSTTAARFAECIQAGIRQNSSFYVHPYKSDTQVEGVIVTGVETFLRDKGWKGIRNGLIEETLQALGFRTVEKLKGAVKGTRTARVAYREIKNV